MGRDFYCTLLVFVLVACSGKLPPAPGGTTSSGGGDGYEAEFKDIAWTVARRMADSGAETNEGISTSKFKETIEKLKLESTEGELKKDGQVVDALNYRDTFRVELSLRRWTRMGSYKKRILVVHEVLSLMGEADSSYTRSSDLLTTLGFSSPVHIYKFVLTGERARLLIDKIEWKAEEVTSHEGSLSAQTRIHRREYRVPRPPLAPGEVRDPHLDKDYLLCEDSAWIDTTSEKAVVKYALCWLSPFHAYVGETGSMHVQLDAKDTDPLLRLFYRSGGAFDHGLIRGDLYQHPEIEFLPGVD